MDDASYPLGWQGALLLAERIRTRLEGSPVEVAGKEGELDGVDVEAEIRLGNPETS